MPSLDNSSARTGVSFETIRHEKEEKRYAGARGEKYDDILPSREGNEENRHDPDE